MYGPDCVTFRRVGVLKAPLSKSFLVTLKRPQSGFGLSMPTPRVWYDSSVKLKPAWQVTQLAFWESLKRFMPRTADPLRAVLSPASERPQSELPPRTVRPQGAIAIAPPSALMPGLP